MTHENILTLFDYHYWARDRMLAALDYLMPEQFLRPLGGSFSSIRDTTAHTLFADELWYERWQGASPTTYPPYESVPDVATVRSRWSEVESRVRAFLNTLDDAEMQREFDYRLLSGANGTSTYAEAMQHLVNHGTYHRGQVTTLLRQCGLNPPASLDLINFYRERRKGIV